jgi:general secretion pathway protein F
MADFTFEALAKTGKREQGTLTAVSERDAAMILDGRGLFPVRIVPVKSLAGGGKSGKRVKGRVMATFYSQLADLLHSGVPLLKSLDLLERQSTLPVLSEVTREVRAKVADGQGLAEAMSAYPNVFTELAVSMVRAGQEGSFMEDVLRRIADFTENQEDLKSKVVGAMAYPVFLGVVGFIILNVLIIFFVPRFEPIFSKLAEKGELPEITQALISVSNFMQSNWWVLILGFVAVVWAFRTWAATESGRVVIDSTKLKLPGFGKLHLSLALSRFTRILGTLLQNGIPILRSLEISKDSTGNRILSGAIQKSVENITAGQKLADPLRRSGYFPIDIVEMIAIAEESNTLEKVLVDVSIALEKRTSRQLELFVRLLEPLMLLVMAGLVMIVVIGLLLPVFKMGSTIG